MTPEFANLVNPTIHHVLNLVEQIKRGDAVDLSMQRARIRRKLEDAELTATSPQCPVEIEDFRLANQGIVYWIDEVITNVDRKWLSDTLEWDYYETNDRAWKFYVEGERKARRKSADLAELWYLLLVLGFEGDIENAFHEHMNEPLPPDTTPEESRKNWAIQLSQQIRETNVSDLAGPPLEGDVRPLVGVQMLRTAATWFAVLLLAFVVLLAWYLVGS